MALSAAVAPDPAYLTGSASITPYGGPGTDVERLDETARRLGRPLRPWARSFSRVALARSGADRWRYPLVVLTVPRQAGKTTYVGAVAVDRCLSMPGARVWYTAQSRLDAVLRFTDLAALLDASPLRAWPTWRRLPPPGGSWDYRVRISAGDERITFANGSEIRVFAPREDSLHGSVTDLVLIDEARFFPADLGDRLLAAALPTQVTRDGQVWILSTAGGPDSTFLAAQVERGRASVSIPSSKMCFGEWSIPEDVGSGDLLGAVLAHHPAIDLDNGPQRAAIELAYETMPAHAFAQEYGNRWLREDLDRLIPSSWWASAAATRGIEGGAGEMSFAFDTAPDRSHSAIVACGHGVVEVIHAERGVRWLAPEVRRLVDAWDPRTVIADPSGPAVTAVEELRPLLGERLVAVKARELVAACGSFYDALDGNALRHLPHAALDDAIAHASQRAISGAWAFSRNDGGHLLVAAALAWWAEARPAESPLEDPAVY